MLPKHQEQVLPELSKVGFSADMETRMWDRTKTSKKIQIKLEQLQLVPKAPENISLEPKRAPLSMCRGPSPEYECSKRYQGREPNCQLGLKTGGIRFRN